MWHIVCRLSAFGSLRHALKGQEEKIIAFPDFFDVGPLEQLLQEDGLKRRVDWLAQAFLLDDDEKSQYEQSFLTALHQIDAIPNGESVLIWTSENAAEQFCLRLVVKLLQQKNVLIYTSNTYYNMLTLCEGKDMRIEIRHSGEVVSERYNEFLARGMYTIISGELQLEYIEELAQCLASDSLVRTWVNGEIRFDEETRDDAFIIQFAEELHSEMEAAYIKAPRLVGTVLGMSEHDISDTWIEYRLRSLIQQNVFLYEGDLREMRKYHVRLQK